MYRNFETKCMSIICYDAIIQTTSFAIKYSSKDANCDKGYPYRLHIW